MDGVEETAEEGVEGDAVFSGGIGECRGGGRTLGDGGGGVLED